MPLFGGESSIPDFQLLSCVQFLFHVYGVRHWISFTYFSTVRIEL